MAQAIVLQEEILAKDISTIDVLWVDSLKNQERLQLSYNAKIHEIIEGIKRRQTCKGETKPLQPKCTDETADSSSNRRNINQGYYF